MIAATMAQETQHRAAQRKNVGRDFHSPGDFDPALYRIPLVAIVRELNALIGDGPALSALPAAAIDRVLRRHPREGKGSFSRTELVAAIRALGPELGARTEALVAAVRMRPVRTHSGVTPVTVLTKPFPCPGTCVFCPNDVRMPKSYLAREPGAQRAVQNGFDPYLQTYNRLHAFALLGHPVTKVELIVLGGTWSFYPEPYQRWFITRCFEAMNDYGRGLDRRADIAGRGVARPALDAASEARTSYNLRVKRSLRVRHGAQILDAEEDRSWAELGRAQHENEDGRCRNVGLVVETRPDQLDEREALRLRQLGCTKVQLGYQSLTDRVLTANRRGHDVAASRRATRLLRGAGFKIHAHYMFNLLGATPEDDVVDFARLFADPDFRPDELKVYPCSLVESADLMAFYRSGEWRPYTHAQLLQVLCEVLAGTPRYCRLSRVVRDISSEDIVAGNRLSNFREVAERALQRAGGRCKDIRAREIKQAQFDHDTLTLRATAYETSIGQEQFLEFVTAEDRVVGFLRLSLPTERSFVPELAESAVIRELHVFGAALDLGARDTARPQHRGLGRRLLHEAVVRARAAGFSDLAVISAVGTRRYYRMLGFADGALYQHLNLCPSQLPLPPSGALASPGPASLPPVQEQSAVPPARQNVVRPTVSPAQGLHLNGSPLTQSAFPRAGGHTQSPQLMSC
jgi:elongator complex protein 3